MLSTGRGGAGCSAAALDAEKKKLRLMRDADRAQAGAATSQRFLIVQLFSDYFPAFGGCCTRIGADTRITFCSTFLSALIAGEYSTRFA